MPQALAIELASSSARTSAGAGTAVDAGPDGVERSASRLVLDVTAFAEVERIRLIVETAPGSSGPWLELDALDIDQTGEYDLSVGNTKRWLRLRWEFAGADGSPSVTFSVTGEAHQVYINPRDLKSAIRVIALDEITTLTARADACIAVSDEADGYLNGAYMLPLVSWDDGLRGQLARMAVRYALDACGWQPEGPDGVIEKSFDRALTWLKSVKKGTVRPPNIVDSTPSKNKNSARVGRVRSAAGRGWGCD